MKINGKQPSYSLCFTYFISFGPLVIYHNLICYNINYQSIISCKTMQLFQTTCPWLHPVINPIFYSVLRTRLRRRIHRFTKKVHFRLFFNWNLKLIFSAICHWFQWQHNQQQAILGLQVNEIENTVELFLSYRFIRTSQQQMQIQMHRK